MISQVTDTLFIGSAQALVDVKALQAHAITDIVFLHDRKPAWPGDHVTLHDHPFPDGERLSHQRLNTIINTVGDASQGGHVLVACAAGISRSSTVVLAYLVHNGMPLEAAYKHLLAHHAIADPHPKLWETLIDYFGLNVTWLDVMQWRIEGKQ
jgi:predicted protein tyrosine phosphatase